MFLKTLGEVEKRAYPAFKKIADMVENDLDPRLASSDLGEIDLEICYIPILMPPDLQAIYPSRSKYDRKLGVSFPCPQLTYDCFVSGTQPEQIQEFVNGLHVVSEHLKIIGVTADAQLQYREILSISAEELSR